VNTNRTGKTCCRKGGGKKKLVCYRQNKIQYVVTGCGVWFFIRVPVSRGIHQHTPPPKKSRKLW
jgi:hypothetical protein